MMAQKDILVALGNAHLEIPGTTEWRVLDTQLVGLHLATNQGGSGPMHEQITASLTAS